MIKGCTSSPLLFSGLHLQNGCFRGRLYYLNSAMFSSIDFWAQLVFFDSWQHSCLCEYNRWSVRVVWIDNSLVWLIMSHGFGHVCVFPSRLFSRKWQLPWHREIRRSMSPWWQALVPLVSATSLHNVSLTFSLPSSKLKYILQTSKECM